MPIPKAEKTGVHNKRDSPQAMGSGVKLWQRLLLYSGRQVCMFLWVTGSTLGLLLQIFNRKWQPRDSIWDKILYLLQSQMQRQELWPHKWDQTGSKAQLTL